jgi:hypothetical protein
MPVGLLLLAHVKKRTRSQTCRLLLVGFTNSLPKPPSGNAMTATITINNSRVCEDLGRHDKRSPGLLSHGTILAERDMRAIATVVTSVWEYSPTPFSLNFSAMALQFFHSDTQNIFRSGGIH